MQEIFIHLFAQLEKWEADILTMSKTIRVRGFVVFIPNLDVATMKDTFYHEVFMTKKEAQKRKYWLVNLSFAPKKCKVLPVTISYSLPSSSPKKKKR